MKKRKYLFITVKKTMLFASVLFFMLILSFCSNETIPAAKSSLLLCAQSVIPSLFPFFVLSKILISTDFAETIGKFLSPFMKFLFSTSPNSAIAFIIGIISGYPAGAKAVCNLYQSGKLTQSEAEKLLPFCNNSGPLFIIGAVGATMLKNPDSGLLLYGIHIISALLTGIFINLTTKKDSSVLRPLEIPKKQESFGVVFSESVKDAVNSTLYVCGFVILFSSLLAPFYALLPADNPFVMLLKGMLEVTSGAKELSAIPYFRNKLPLISGILGFGGICVFLQVLGISSSAFLSTKLYIRGKIFQGLISLLICKLYIAKTETVDVFMQAETINFQTGNFGAMITSIFIICIFYLFIISLRKNFKKY